jgi:NAD(P)-dependent dehydrogenase (short-subunit alcohol dehydrogenase family)
LVDINDDQVYLDELKINFNQCNIFFENADIGRKETVKMIFKKYFDEFGSIDLVVNSAGIINEQNVELTFQVNVVSIV